MKNRKRQPSRTSIALPQKKKSDSRSLSNRILQLAFRDLSWTDFLRDVSRLILDSTGCDDLRLQFLGRGWSHPSVATRVPQFSFHIEEAPTRKQQASLNRSRPGIDLERLREGLIRGRIVGSPRSFSPRGTFWSNHLDRPLRLQERIGRKTSLTPFHFENDCRSLALIPMVADKRAIGWIEIKSARRSFFTRVRISEYEGIADTLAAALSFRRTQLELRKRVSNLTCLYGVSRLMERVNATQDEILRGIAELLPPAFLHPELVSSRIVVDGQTYDSRGFREGRHRHAVDIVINGERRGSIEVATVGSAAGLAENRSSREERALLETVAREVARLVERFTSEQEKIHLEDQLRHADRLATIGQLAAGVAHEINEPLGSILGFAQLAMKSQDLPPQARQDVEKIVSATLHAREVVKKLMLFSRQMPPRTDTVNLNQVIEDGLYFLGARCRKAGIELVRDLQPNLPTLTADPSQLHQVLVNLVVNAVQAMPEGGRLTLQTRCRENFVSMIVEDTGIGMSEEVMKQIFIPFFTTKEVGEGTGLGLPVVHGIVTSHGGVMKVKSQVGMGSRFEIQLPVKLNQQN